MYPRSGFLVPSLPPLRFLYPRSGLGGLSVVLFLYPRSRVCSQGQAGGLREAEKVYVSKVYVPSSFAISLVAWR